MSPVYQDRHVIVIVPLGWEHPGHVLVIPKRAVRNLMDMTPLEMSQVLQTARRAAVAQQRAFGASGFSIEQNNGRNQSVCHAHFHVIPNTPAEPVENASAEQLEAVAARLRAVFPRR